MNIKMFSIGEDVVDCGRKTMPVNHRMGIMAFIAMKCPRCSGDIQLDDKNQFGFCMYCGTRIMNDKYVNGHITVDKTKELKNALVLAKIELESGNWEAAKPMVENILIMDSECPDGWFMNALLSKAACDDNKYNSTLNKGRACASKSCGIFSERDIDKLCITVRFIGKRGLMSPDCTFVLFIDNVEHRFQDHMNIGVKPGEHEMVCTVEDTGGRIYNKARMKYIMDKPCTFQVKLGSMGLTIKAM